jgi:hypothetical protein
MAAVADFDFVRATFAGEMPPSQADTNAQLARVVGGRIGRRQPSPLCQNSYRTILALGNQIADTAVIKVGLVTLSLAMVRETQNAT